MIGLITGFFQIVLLVLPIFYKNKEALAKAEKAVIDFAARRSTKAGIALGDWHAKRTTAQALDEIRKKREEEANAVQNGRSQG